MFYVSAAGGFPIQWQLLQQIVETHDNGPKSATTACVLVKGPANIPSCSR